MLLPPLGRFRTGPGRLFLAVLAFAVLAPFSLRAQDESGDGSLYSKLIEPIPDHTDAGSRKIIETHLKALGGQEALNKIEAVRISSHMRRAHFEGDLIMTETGNPYRYHVKTTVKRLGKLYDKFEGYNGEILWEYDPNEKRAFPKQIDGLRLKDAANGFFLDPCLDWEARGCTFEYLGEVKSKGRPHYLLKMYTPAGRTLFLYFEAKTLMITRMGAEIIFGGAIVDEDVYNTSFEKVNGVWFPVAQEYYIDNQKLGEGKITLIEVNPEIEPGLFDMPKVRERWLRQQ
jgi:hypothetical protein